MNQTSSNGETHSVFISYRSREQGEGVLSRLRGLLARAEKHDVLVFSSSASWQEETSGEEHRELMHRFLDRVGRYVLISGNVGRGKSMMPAWLAGQCPSEQEDGRKAIIRALISPGGMVSNPEKFEWGRLCFVVDSPYYLTDFSLQASKESPAIDPFNDVSQIVCEHYLAQAESEESDELFTWSRASRDGFLLNRLLSYPQSELLKFGEGVRGLGGLVPAFQLAWKLIYWNLVSQARFRVAAPTMPGDREGSLFEWATALAFFHGCEVLVDNEPDLKGCLIETPGRLAIHLSSHLDIKARRLVVLHELAHHVLKHMANTEYGLDPTILTTDMLWTFKRQERTADALASIWSYLFEGLDAIVMEIGRHHNTLTAQTLQSQLHVSLESCAASRLMKDSEVHCGSP